MKKRNMTTSPTNSIPLQFIALMGCIYLAFLGNFGDKSWFFQWENIRPEIKDSVLVAQYYGLSSGCVGIGCTEPQQYKRRFWIMNNATTDELLKLTQFPNDNVQAIAYEGLIKTIGFKDKTELILTAIKDTTAIIHYRSGCLGYNYSLSEYLYQEVLGLNEPLLFPPHYLQKRYGLAKEEEQRIKMAYENRLQKIYPF